MSCLINVFVGLPFFFVLLLAFSVHLTCFSPAFRRIEFDHLLWLRRRFCVARFWYLRGDFHILFLGRFRLPASARLILMPLDLIFLELAILVGHIPWVAL